MGNASSSPLIPDTSSGLGNLFTPTFSPDVATSCAYIIGSSDTGIGCDNTVSCIVGTLISPQPPAIMPDPCNSDGIPPHPLCGSPGDTGDTGTKMHGGIGSDGTTVIHGPLTEKLSTP